MKFLAISSLVLIAACSVTAKLISISLQKVDPVHKAMLKEGIDPREIEKTLQYFKNGSVLPVPLIKQIDNEFLGEILLGHPGQKFNVAFDTTWDDIWVPIVSCPDINIACKFRNKYDPSRSPFSNATSRWLNETFGKNLLVGRVYSDLMHINVVNITKRYFAAVEDIPSLFSVYRYDGIVGLNFGTDFYMPALIDSMKAQNLIDKRVFSFYFNRRSLTRKAGTLCIGGVETRHFKGNFSYVDVIKAGRQMWAIHVDKISVTKTKACEGGCTALLSTGTFSILGPRSDIQNINIAIKAKYLYMGFYSVNCDTIPTLPKIMFTINGTLYTLNGFDYIDKINVLDVFTVCLSAFAVNDVPDDQTWYMGASFMSKYYTAFDVDRMRVGFAKALYEEENEHISVNIV